MLALNKGEELAARRKTEAGQVSVDPKLFGLARNYPTLSRAANFFGCRELEGEIFEITLEVLRRQLSDYTLEISRIKTKLLPAAKECLVEACRQSGINIDISEGEYDDLLMSILDLYGSQAVVNQADLISLLNKSPAFSGVGEEVLKEVANNFNASLTNKLSDVLGQLRAAFTKQIVIAKHLSGSAAIEDSLLNCCDLSGENQALGQEARQQYLAAKEHARQQIRNPESEPDKKEIDRQEKTESLKEELDTLIPEAIKLLTERLIGLGYGKEIVDDALDILRGQARELPDTLSKRPDLTTLESWQEAVDEGLGKIYTDFKNDLGVRIENVDDENKKTLLESAFNESLAIYCEKLLEVGNHLPDIQSSKRLSM